MKNYLYLPILLVILLMSCSPNDDQSKIVLKTSGYPDSTKIYLWEVEKQSNDSGYIINDNLVFYANVDEPSQFSIRTVFKTRDEFEIKYFWKENKALTISFEKGNMKNARIEGSVIQKQADFVDTRKNQLQESNDSLKQVYDSWDKDDKEGRLAIRKKGREITQAIEDVDISYVKNNPDELFSAITLNQLMSYSISKDKTQELYKSLSPENQSTEYGLNVKKFLEISTDLKVGDKALDFKLPDLNGNLVGIDDFKGKYILLDFWASNCGVCRMGNPNLLKNYKKYQEKGFEIISISFDKNKENWAKAVENDGMIWTTVCDLKGSNGDVIMAYNAYLMPTYYLIDPNGVIIFKHLGRMVFDEKLKEIFPNS